MSERVLVHLAVCSELPPSAVDSIRQYSLSYSLVG